MTYSNALTALTSVKFPKSRSWRFILAFLLAFSVMSGSISAKTNNSQNQSIGLKTGFAEGDAFWNSQTVPPPPPQPQMPDESHRTLASHAADSYGLSGMEATWIAQGAYDEDHCDLNYPPCSGLLGLFGFHSWNPDTDGYWTPIIIESGSGLGHINLLFDNAVNAYLVGNYEVSYLWLGRAVHILGDVGTPAHVHLDEHADGDTYEDWLGVNDLENTAAWIVANPPGPEWDMDFHDLPTWDELNTDLQNSLNDASLEYGGRGSGEELWNLGPVEYDHLILFRLMFLVAEEADNWDSDDAEGEKIRHRN